MYVHKGSESETNIVQEIWSVVFLRFDYFSLIKPKDCKYNWPANKCCMGPPKTLLQLRHFGKVMSILHEENKVA